MYGGLWLGCIGSGDVEITSILSLTPNLILMFLLNFSLQAGHVTFPLAMLLIYSFFAFIGSFARIFTKSSVIEY